MSLRGDNKSPGMSLKASSKTTGPTPTKRRNSTLWSETLDVHQKSTFSTKEIKRQEVLKFSFLKSSHLESAESRKSDFLFAFLLQAIHELYRGEQDLIEDLQLARKVGTFLFKNHTKKSKHICSLPSCSRCCLCFRHTMIRC